MLSTSNAAIISILKTQNRRCIESPDTIKVNLFLLIAHLSPETGHSSCIPSRSVSCVTAQLPQRKTEGPYARD